MVGRALLFKRAFCLLTCAVFGRALFLDARYFRTRVCCGRAFCVGRAFVFWTLVVCLDARFSTCFFLFGRELVLDAHFVCVGRALLFGCAFCCCWTRSLFLSDARFFLLWTFFYVCGRALLFSGRAFCC